jgi:hypothetical protein
LKKRVTKNEGSINGNTQDINVLLKEMKDAKEEIERLKKLLKDGADGKNNNSNINSGR